jgi:GT2 family glycosyltransferase/glycosyltransferase involved in cell wall biosynthesis
MRRIRDVYFLSYEYSLFVTIKLYRELNRRLSKKTYGIPSGPIQSLPEKKWFKKVFQVIATTLMPLTAIRLIYFWIKDLKEGKYKEKKFFRTRIDRTSQSFIFFGPIDWEYRKQRPQNLAISLMGVGKDIFYVNPTVMYHSKKNIEIKFKKIDGVSVGTFYSNYHRRSYYIGIKPIPNELEKEFAGVVEQTIALFANFSTTVIIQQPGWWSLVRHLVGNQMIFDCMDLHSGFEQIASGIIDLESEIDATVDQIIVSSQYLLETKAKNYAEKTVCIRNGVHFSHFPFLVHPIDREQIVVGYFGALAEWFDTELFAALAKNNPKIRFEIIGLVSDTRITRELKEHSNIAFLGEVPNTELPSLITQWRAGLIPFKLSPLIHATNPVKMYEYAASGIPVLATGIPEVRMISESLDGVYVASTTEEFQKNLETALRLSESDRLHLREWSQNQSWKSRSVELLQSIEDNPKVSVIVLMWNQGLLTLNCLKSVYERSDYKNLEVILVDNGSDMEESAIVTSWIENYSSGQTIYVRNKENLGFAAGNNVGLKIATGDFMVVLNNDTEVTPGWIWRSIKHFAVNPRLGLLGPSTNNCGNEARVILRNDDGNWLQEVIPRFGLRELRAIPATTVAFFCVFISRAALDAIGLISEDYGRGYFEDDDYCRRAQAAGYEISIARDIFVFHQMSASFDLLGDSAKAELFKANKAVYESKWGKWIPHTYTFDEDQR